MISVVLKRFAKVAQLASVFALSFYALNTNLGSTVQSMMKSPNPTTSFHGPLMFLLDERIIILVRIYVVG